MILSWDEIWNRVKKGVSKVLALVQTLSMGLVKERLVKLEIDLEEIIYK